MSREGHACEAQGTRPPGGAGRRSPGWTGSVGGAGGWSGGRGLRQQAGLAPGVCRGASVPANCLKSPP